MSRTTHDATVHSGERFGVEKAANCRVIVERHLAHFELRIHPDLKNIDLDHSLPFDLATWTVRMSIRILSHFAETGDERERGRRIMERLFTSLEVWEKYKEAS